MANNPNSRLQALRAAGINTSGMVGLTGVETGSDASSDSVSDMIREGGVIPERRLFRRWVMSQMFHMMDERMSITAALNRKGYAYQWKMAIEEYRVLAKLETRDPEAFEERSEWFTTSLAAEMCLDCISRIQKEFKKQALKKKRCNGRLYVHLGTRDIFKTEVSVLTARLDNIVREYLNGSRDYQSAHNLLVEFWEAAQPYTCRKFHFSSRWVAAYKGAGAFYTIKSLIIFSGCRYSGLNQDESLENLKNIGRRMNSNEGWRMYGEMVTFIMNNNIDIQQMMRSWREGRRS